MFAKGFARPGLESLLQLILGDLCKPGRCKSPTTVWPRRNIANNRCFGEEKKKTCLSCKFEVFLPASTGTGGLGLVLSSCLGGPSCPRDRSGWGCPICLSTEREGICSWDRRELVVSGSGGLRSRHGHATWLEIPTGVQCVLCTKAMAQWREHPILPKSPPKAPTASSARLCPPSLPRSPPQTAGRGGTAGWHPQLTTMLRFSCIFPMNF